ncbi:TPA: hypothetical protein ENX78_12815, partial [Candidatus Poribacteria bacterium]|nr:hypothetical protein [Candidatus Poribacteria bacterium]
MRTEKISNLPFYMKVTQKKTNGIVYTPRWIVDFILDGIEYKHNIYNKKIIDPSCGRGNFLIVVVERFLKDCIENNLDLDEIRTILHNNIFGFDIDENAIIKCKAYLNDITYKYGIDEVDWNILYTESELKNLYPYTYEYFLAIKDRLLLRDK